MSFIKKIKDILFEEEDITEPIKTRKEVTSIPPEEEIEEELKVPEEPKTIVNEPVTSERETFKKENNFQLFDFDEDEFNDTLSKQRPNTNVLDYERKIMDRRNEVKRHDRIDPKEYTERKKFKPSPIISPVYGILNQDYVADDIKNKGEESISIEEVRKKAFESAPQPKPIEEIDEPVVTFFDEKKNDNDEINNNYKSIDDLLEETSIEIEPEDMEVPNNNLDEIEEELEKLDVEKKEMTSDDENDLFELIDSMYEDRKDGE